MNGAVAMVLAYAMHVGAASAQTDAVSTDIDTISIATYEMTRDEPRCAAPGAIAFRAEFRLPLQVGTFPMSSGFLGGNSAAAQAGSCTIRTRRGAEVSEIAIPCPEDGDAGLQRRADQQAFCQNDTAPVVVGALAGSVTVCLGVEGHAFLDGTWVLTASTPHGDINKSGTLGEDGVDLRYLSSSPPAKSRYQRIVTRPDGMAPAAIAVDLWFADLTLDGLPDMKIGMVATAAGVLVAASDTACVDDPDACFAITEYNDVTLRTSLRAADRMLNRDGFTENEALWRLAGYCADGS